jgi:hypothetical protein
MSTHPVRPFQRVILLGTPLAYAVVTALHPTSGPGPGQLGLPVTRWLAVHGLQAVLTVFLAYCIWILLDGIDNRAATTARVALPVFLVFFSTFDAVAGLATGWLGRVAEGQTGAEQAATLRAADELFNGNWLTGNISIAGSISAIAWATVAIAGAVALRRAGADGLTVGLMAGSLLFVNHPVPSGTVGMLALLIAAYRWDRARSRTPGGGTPPRQPARTPPDTHPAG